MIFNIYFDSDTNTFAEFDSVEASFDVKLTEINESMLFETESTKPMFLQAPEDIFVFQGESGINLVPATDKILGGIKVGDNLSITPDGVLSVMTTNNAEIDNTKPITSAGAFTIIGNIDVLLKTI